jgi:hypothetical protein
MNNGKGQLIGWSVVLLMWTGCGVGLSYMQENAIHDRNIRESINTAEDMVGWIVEDVSNEKLDSTIADTYIDNLEEVITDLREVR